MKDQIAIHESENSERVIRFVNIEGLPDNIQKLYNNGSLYGIYLKGGLIIAKDIWEVEHQISIWIKK